MAIGSKKDNLRKYPGVGGSRNNPVNIELKRREASERNSAWQALTLSAQLAQLDVRLGKGEGAKKQRAKIAARLAAKPVAVSANVQSTVENIDNVKRTRAKDRRAARQEKPVK